MSDDEKAKKSKTTSDEDETLDEAGFIWQSNNVDQHSATDEGVPSDENDSQEQSISDKTDTDETESPGRIWNRIAGELPEDTSIDRAGDDPFERPAEENDFSILWDDTTDETKQERAWDTFLSGISPGRERDDAITDREETERDISTLSEQTDAEVAPGEQSPSPPSEPRKPPDDRTDPDLASVDDLDMPVLVLNSGDQSASDRYCAQLLQQSVVGEPAVIFLSIERPAAECIAVLGDVPGALYGEISVIEVGGFRQSPPPRADKRSDRSAHGDVTIERVSDPTNLSKIGIVTSQVLTEIGETGKQPVICFHSLTTLLSYVSEKELFRFLYILLGFLSTHDALAHFHMDRSEHSEATVQTLKPLFSSVIHITEDGSIRLE